MTAELPEAGGGDMIVLAAVAGAHGIRGEVRLKLFTEDAAGLRAYPRFDAGGEWLTLKSVRAGPNGAVAAFAEIGDRNAAEALRGTPLRVPRSALPPLQADEYYHADLVGLPCVAEDGTQLGLIVSIENFGAGDVIEFTKPDGKTAMFPFRPDVAVLENGVIRVDPAFVV